MSKLSKLLLALASFIALQSPSLSAAHSSAVLSIDEINETLGSFGGDAALEMAQVTQKLFAQHGRPTAIIVGDEMQGSIFVGFRKGEGRIRFHGQDVRDSGYLRWNAPSIGINVGGSVSKVAILVYGAHSEAELRQAFASIQGSYHFIGGAGVSYLTNDVLNRKKNDINLIYISVGLGLDAGIAVERLKFK